MPILDMTLARDKKHSLLPSFVPASVGKLLTPFIPSFISKKGSYLLAFIFSSVGRKLFMALTGFTFVCFVTGHMAGNLTAYAGHWDGGEMMNAYAAFLKGFLHGAGIWIVRAGLLGLLFVHVIVACWLTLDSWAARPKGYRKRKLQATWQSRMMRYTAVFLFLFITYHLLHMTLGWGYVWSSAQPAFEHGHAYQNFVHGFKDPITSGLYIIANICLCLHLWHGIWSFTQTLGLSHPRFEKLRKYGATVWAFTVACVNISFPIAVLTGFLK